MIRISGRPANRLFPDGLLSHNPIKCLGMSALQNAPAAWSFEGTTVARLEDIWSDGARLMRTAELIVSSVLHAKSGGRGDCVAASSSREAIQTGALAGDRKDNQFTV